MLIHSPIKLHSPGKITPVHERIFVCRSGSAADTQALTGYVQHYLALHSMELKDSKHPKVNTCASLFQTLAYENKDHLMAGLIVAGWDPVNGGQVGGINWVGKELWKTVFSLACDVGIILVGMLSDFEFGPAILKICWRFWGLGMGLCIAVNGVDNSINGHAEKTSLPLPL